MDREQMLEELSEFYEGYLADIRNEAERMRDTGMPRLTEELFAIFEQTGDRGAYEKVYFQRRKYLAVFGLKAILDRQPADIRRLEEIISEICSEECWAVPAHVNRSEDREWRSYIDLFAAETAQALSEIVSVLEGEISETIRARVKEEVSRRVFMPFVKSVPPYSSWEYGTSNWCAVCGGAAGSAAMYLLEKDSEIQKRILERICHSLTEYYLKGFAEDGTCMEGLGYFTYGMTYFTGFADQLLRFSSGRMDLFRNRKLESIAAFQAKCYFPSGNTVSFSDGFRRDTFRAGLACYLAMKFPRAGIPPAARASGLNTDPNYRWMALYQTLIWTKQYMDRLRKEEISPPKENTARQVILPAAQWTICSSRSGAGMAAKGGHNGESHNHNDVGSFLYLIGEDLLLTDLGSGEYTRDYFSDKRYEHLCCRSLGHNVPLIDGGEQLCWKEYGCSGFFADGNGRTRIRFEKAYGNPKLKSLTRTLDWDAENGTLMVEDVFEIPDGLCSVRENLVTQRKPEISGNRIWIRGSRRACRITVDIPDADICCIPESFLNHKGIREDVFLIQWEVTGTGEDGRARSRFMAEECHFDESPSAERYPSV